MGDLAMEIITASPEETETAGEKIGQWLVNPSCICLFGDLGAGKTTFIRGLARGLGAHKKTVKSPTYVYLVSYPLKSHDSGAKKLWHMDCYRLDEAEDSVAPDDLLEPLENSNDFVAIEWAERIADFLPEERMEISFDFLEGDRRSIKIRNISGIADDE